MIVNRFGDLVRLDTFGNARAHERARNRMTQQDSLWAHLKQKVMQPGEGGGDIGDLFGPGSGDDGAGDGGYPGMSGMSGSGASSNPRRRRSSLKRNSQMQGSGNGSSSSSSGPGSSSGKGF